MPFQPPEQVKCPKCGKSVYAAEERAVGELKFHKECYKCSMCNKMLDSTNVNCHETVLFCKTCHARKYGPKGYGFGGGAGCLNMDTGAHLDKRDAAKEYKPPRANPGEGCPRCGGKVYAAELMMAKGKEYHRSCFNCKACRKPLDSVVHCDGPDKEVYCKVCYGKQFGPKGYGFGHGGGTLTTIEAEYTPIVRPHGNPDFITKAPDGEEPCPRCGGRVFNAEMMMAKGRSWHKKCFSCCHCHRPLDSVVGCDAPDGEIYCKLCYAKKYGPKGYGFAAGGGGVLVAENISGTDVLKESSDIARMDVSKIQDEEGKGCPRCGGKVFMAEEMHARGRKWHKRCFSCCHCHRPLDSVVGCDAPDGEIYCKLCYAKKYGPKGYGFAAGGGGILVAENIPGGEQNMEGVSYASAANDTANIPAAPGEGCPRCGGKVFTAEEKLSRGKRWHKRCYHCRECRRPLDSMVLCDGPDGEIYCKLCYAKKFGPKGYGFAAGSGGILFPEDVTYDELSDTVTVAKPIVTFVDVTKIPAKEGQSRCPRCGGAVFQAEAMLARAKEWHKRCFNCCECHRPLDSMVACDAPDGEIYCRLCYAKRHGPKGYGYGHVPALVSMGPEDGTLMPTDIRQFGFKIKEARNLIPQLGGDKPLVDGVMIPPPRDVPIEAGIPIPRGFEDSQRKAITEQVVQSTTTTTTKAVEETHGQEQTVSQKRKEEHVPIVAGMHMDGQDSVPIVAGVVPGAITTVPEEEEIEEEEEFSEEDVPMAEFSTQTADFYPNNELDNNIIPPESEELPDLTTPEAFEQPATEGLTNIPPEMMAEMAALQGGISEASHFSEKSSLDTLNSEYSKEFVSKMETRSEFHSEISEVISSEMHIQGSHAIETNLSLNTKSSNLPLESSEFIQENPDAVGNTEQIILTAEDGVADM